MIDCDAGNPRGKHVFIFDGEKNSERCRCQRYEATRSSHLEFDRQVVPASAVPPLCKECGQPGKLYERPAERRWVHEKREDGRHHDFVTDPVIYDINTLAQDDGSGMVFSPEAIESMKGQTVPLVDRRGPEPKVIGTATVGADGKVRATLQERLIHWSGTPQGVCERKDSGADVYHSPIQPTGGTVHLSGQADHPGNVTCPTCKARADRGCNRHSDCRMATDDYTKKHGTIPPPNFHCYDETCEDCFGS